MSEREPTSASFEPERLTRKGRRVDPVVAVTSVVAVGLLVAVLKPWGGTDPASPSPNAIGDTAVASPALTTDPTAAEPAAPSQPPRVTWPEVVAVSQAHDEWGARAILRPRTESPDEEASLEELWAPAQATVTGWSQVQLPLTDMEVVALGITHPVDALPLDARVWWYGPDRAWHWLDAQRLDPSPWGGALQFTPPVRDGVQQPAWTAGRYRIEVLVDGGIRRIDVAVREFVSVLLEPGTGVADPPPRGAFSADVGGVAQGPFLTIDGDAVPIQAPVADPSTSPADAWLAGGSSPVAVLREPRASGIGVMLPVGATEIEAAVRTLGPETLSGVPKQIVRTRVDDGPRTPYVVFGSPGGGAWPAGTYAIDTAWWEGGRRLAATYLVEFAPSGTVEPLALAAARTFLGSAVTGHGPAGDVAVPSTELSCSSDAGTSVDEPAFIGVRHRIGQAPEAITLQRETTPGRYEDQPILVARDVAPGVSMIGPADRAAFPRGVYRLTTGGEAPTRLCIGVEAPAR